MKHLRNLTFIVSGLVFFSATVFAQEPDPWFDIEVIVYSQKSPGAETSEMWPEDPGRPELDNTIPLQSLLKAQNDLVSPYSLLPRSEWKLAGEYGQLKRSSHYNPLLHLAWRQPVTNSKKAQAIYLQSEDQDRIPQLEGLIKISVHRYLHVGMDLLLRDDNRPSVASGLTNMQQPKQHFFRLKDNRRMRSGELHYIDHPMMGVLVLISRYVPPKPAETVVKSLTSEILQADTKAESAPPLPGVTDKSTTKN